MNPFFPGAAGVPGHDGVDSAGGNRLIARMKTKRPSARPREDSPGVVIMPPAILLALTLTGIALETTLPPDRGRDMPALLWGGILLAALGFAFMMWAHGRFKSLGVNVVTVLPASRLVTDGAHRFSRNPMYVGLVAMLLGVGLALASVWLCAMTVPLVFYFCAYAIPREEAYLKRRFGLEYDDYCEKVRRWL